MSATYTVATDDEIVQFLADHIAEHGMPPSIREVGAALGFKSPAGIHMRLRRLVDDGRLKIVGTQLPRFAPVRES